MVETIRKIATAAVNLTGLFFYFCYQIIMSGWVVGWLVLKGYRGEKGIMVDYIPSVKSKWAVVLLFNLISMTPGSLSVDISDEDNTILVHLLDGDGKEDFYKVTGKIEGMLNKIFS